MVNPQSRNDSFIVIDHVCKSYGNFQVLKNISAKVNRSEVVAICAPSGSGKSILIRTINRLETISSIRINSRDIQIKLKARKLNAMRSQIGFVFQNFNLFPHLSVPEKITLSPIRVKGESKSKAQATTLSSGSAAKSRTSG